MKNKIIKISISGQPKNITANHFLIKNYKKQNNIEFFLNDENIKKADFWFIIEDCPQILERCNIPKGNVCFLSAEVVHPPGYYDFDFRKKFLSQFDNIFTCHDICGTHVIKDLPFLPWMINANHGNKIFTNHSRSATWLLNNSPEKSNDLLSVICSNQSMTSGHRRRLKFVTELKKYYGNKLHWFGNGVNPLEEKWDGIAPYKYHIAIENHRRNNIITEKLYDCFLAEAYPYYYGAPNVKEFFDRQGFSEIDIEDSRKSINIINKAMEEMAYENNLFVLQEQKKRVLEKYNLFYRILSIAEQLANENTNPFFQERVIKSMKHFYLRSGIKSKTLVYIDKISRASLGYVDKINFYNALKELEIK